MVNIPLKIFVCFLLSASVLVGMAFYFYGSIVYEPAEVSMLVAVFLTLFLFFFFCFNMRQVPADKLEAFAEPDEEEPIIQDSVLEYSSLNEYENEDLEELEAVGPEVGSPKVDSEIATVLLNPSRVSNIRLAFGDDDIPYLVESSGLELVDGDLDEIVRFIRGTEPEELPATILVEEAELEELPETIFVEQAEPEEFEELPLIVSITALDNAVVSDDAAVSDDIIEIAELEDISTGFGGILTIFNQPFTFSPGSLDVLHGAATQVIYEQNGIHFINTNFDAEGVDKILDSNFAKLVESVLASAPGD
jgi:hypothetical protein